MLKLKWLVVSLAIFTAIPTDSEAGVIVNVAVAATPVAAPCPPVQRQIAGISIHAGINIGGGGRRRCGSRCKVKFKQRCRSRGCGSQMRCVHRGGCNAQVAFRSSMRGGCGQGRSRMRGHC